jgi:hypothetical protein
VNGLIFGKLIACLENKAVMNGTPYTGKNNKTTQCIKKDLRILIDK